MDQYSPITDITPLDLVAANTNPSISTGSPTTSTGSPTTPMPNTDTYITLSWMTIFRYIMIILILAFLGFNLFGTLGEITDKLKQLLAPLLSTLGYDIGQTIKQTTQVSATGAKAGIDIAAGTIDDAVTLLEKGVGVKDVSFKHIDDRTPTTHIDDRTPTTHIDNRTTNQDVFNQSVKHKQRMTPSPDEAGSTTQRTTIPKSGFCYIGEDRGFRSCIKVENADECMSGDIFPSREICVNPNLRD